MCAIFYRRTCPGFTSGGLKINGFLCDSLRQISFTSAVSVFLDYPNKKPRLFKGRGFIMIYFLMDQSFFSMKSVIMVYR